MPNDNYPTDNWIKSMFDPIMWFDPCPLDPNYFVDGLDREWDYDRIYINPPYSNPLPWVRRAIEQARKGSIVVLLLKHDSSTKWYRELHEAGARFLMVQGRLKHGTGKTAPFPSILAVLEGIQ